ncbi:MAG TPA: sigma-70 family RNA polymerase sigma factor [Pyrinomonadaceae bacterium]
MFSDLDKGADGDFCNLLREIRSGFTSFDILFENPLFRRRLRVMIAAHQRKPADAEELENDIRLKVWRSFGGFTPDYTKDYGNFFAWLRSIVRTSFLDTLKNGLVYDDERPEDLSPAELKSNAERKFREAELRKELQECIDSLTERERIAVNCFLQGLTSREAADVLTAAGFPCSHVTALMWARDGVRAYFQKRAVGTEEPIARKNYQVARKRKDEESSSEEDRKKNAAVRRVGKTLKS